jgi:putative FmdB family regulatory protein
MPIHDYVCANCGYEIEVMHSVHGHGPSTCRECGGPMKRAIAAPAVHFKGTGWARKDRSDSGKRSRAASGEADAKSEGGAVSGSSGRESSGASSGEPSGGSVSDSAPPAPASVPAAKDAD